MKKQNAGILSHPIKISGGYSMLDLHLTIEGDKIIIDGLQKFAAELPGAVQKGLAQVGAGVFTEALYWLKGAGGASKKVRSDYVGFTKKSGEEVKFRSYKGAGGYPVPIRTKNLLSHLNWLFPGKSKSDDSGSFTAGPFETVIYDSAAYANVIHEGRGSSAKFGPRRYLTDALEKFNQGAKISDTIEDEIEKAIAKAGLK
jgi:hypothetical protein